MCFLLNVFMEIIAAYRKNIPVNELDFAVYRMKLFTHFSVIKTIFSFKVNVSKDKNIEEKEELGKLF